MIIKKIIHWLLRLVAAIILLQTLYFKFTAHPESVTLFTKLVGNTFEAPMRIGTGILELIAGVLLLFPKTTFWGAFLGVGLMSGAIVSHLTVIGIESQQDGGQLFIYAIVVWVSCFLLLLINKKQGFNFWNRIKNKK